MEEKKNLLSKFNLKDYKNDLELILDKKDYEEEAKSLILNIFYKLDNFYKDYMTVKIECEPKNKYLEDFIELIQNKCNKISIIQPQNVKNGKKYDVDRKAGIIKCIPNEYILFYAINELKEKNYENEKYLLDDFPNKCVNSIISKGKAINDTEPLRDFNGWSWNVQIEDNNNITYNLLYQNLLLIFGYQFLNDNIGKLNIIDILHNKIVELGYEYEGIQFVDTIIEICVVLYSNISKSNYEKCLKYKNRLKNRISMISSRKEYVNDIYRDSSDSSAKIKNIDNMLEDINLLRKEYLKSTKDGKSEYLGLSNFVEAKEKEREKLLKEIKENNKLLTSKKYIKEQDEYSMMFKYFESIKEESHKINLSSRIVKLQKYFLQCFDIQINNLTLKKDIILYIKKLRYYSNVLLKKDKKVVKQDQVNKIFELVANKTIDKAIELKLFDIGFKNEAFNYEILKYVFETKIIEIENIVLKVLFIENNEVKIEYYDSKTLEYKRIFQIPIDEETINKKDKKIKLFKVGG